VEAVNNPEDESAGKREIPFGREIYIDADDFKEEPPPKYFRLSPGKSVRLRYAGFVTCTGCDKDPSTGEVTAVRGTWTPPEEKVKVKGTIHWVPAAASVTAEVRLYDRLFKVEEPDAGGDTDFKEFLDPASLVVAEARLEPALKDAEPGQRFQFERLGYFCVDPDHTGDHPVFNRTVTLRDTRGKPKGK
jgi:glutaminyl-tRNA synthetase